jgi:hypothetical protein
MSTSQHKVLYLAYGANMSSRKLLARGVIPLEKGRAAVVASKKVAFCHRGGFATLLELSRSVSPVRDPPHLDFPCHGVVYRLTENDMRLLARAETGYRRARIAVETYEGQPLLAETFVSQPSLVLKSVVPPTERYLKLMSEGGNEHALSREYLLWLGAVQPWDGNSDREARFDTPSTLYANVGLACTFGICVVLSLMFLH